MPKNSITTSFTNTKHLASTSQINRQYFF